MKSTSSFGENKSIQEVYALLNEKKAELSIYSPYSFLNDLDYEVLSNETFIQPLVQDISAGLCQLREVNINGYRHFFVYRNLAWDTKYFKRSINRIDLILFAHSKPDIVSRAVSCFIEENILGDDYYLINIPCEDLILLQGLSDTGFRLVETRLNYYFTNFLTAQPPNGPVRKAESKDIPALREVAMHMRNRYDRIHADPAFSTKQGDAYLGTFIEESVNGFADMVLIPDLPAQKPFGFLAANNPHKILGYNISKLVLAAVDNTVQKGWLYKLLVGVIHELKKQNTNILTTITQASNRPAIHTWEKAGFKLGFVTHIYSFSR